MQFAGSNPNCSIAIRSNSMNIYDHQGHFQINKYTSWYYKIINQAKSKNRIKTKNNYYEKHHILPKCWWPQYSKEKWNLVYLTAKEHWICHQLLTKMTIGKLKGKMITALAGMIRNSKNQNRYIPCARIYNLVRKNAAAAHSERMKGRTLSDELKDKMSKERKGKPKSNTHKEAIAKSLVGHQVSREVREKISAAQKGRKHTAEHRAKNSAALSGTNNPMFGKKHSEETRAKIRESIAKRKLLVKS